MQDLNSKLKPNEDEQRRNWQQKHEETLAEMISQITSQ